jgi:hypothetical protein
MPEDVDPRLLPWGTGIADVQGLMLYTLLNHGEKPPVKTIYQDKEFRVLSNGDLIFHNGTFCGIVYKEVDGYYHWVSTHRDGRPLTGAWSTHALEGIVTVLRALNVDWDEELKNL